MQEVGAEGAYKDRVASLIGVVVAVQDHIHSSLIQNAFHGQSHALILLEMSSVCRTTLMISPMATQR